MFNKNTVKSSYSCLPNAANLINKSNTKRFQNNQCIEPPKCNCINKANYSLKGKCQYVCILLYKLEVHNCGPNNSNVSSND